MESVEIILMLGKGAPCAPPFGGVLHRLIQGMLVDYPAGLGVPGSPLGRAGGSCRGKAHQPALLILLSLQPG